MNKWDLKEKKEVFDTPWMSIEENIYKVNGQEAKYFKLNRPDYVLVVAEQEKKIVLEKNYRWAIGKEIFELPAGWIEKGETPEQAAKRELLEETGYNAECKLLTSLIAQPSFSDMTAHVVLAKIKDQKDADPDSDENPKITFNTLEEINKMIRDEKIVDMGMISAIKIYENYKNG